MMDDQQWKAFIKNVETLYQPWDWPPFVWKIFENYLRLRNSNDVQSALHQVYAAGEALYSRDLLPAILKRLKRTTVGESVKTEPITLYVLKQVDSDDGRKRVFKIWGTLSQYEDKDYCESASIRDVKELTEQYGGRWAKICSLNEAGQIIDDKSQF